MQATIVALLFLGAVSALDMSFSPSTFSAVNNQATGGTLFITNTMSPTGSLTSVSYTIFVNSSGVTFSYNGGGTKCSIGTISSGSQGGCGFSYAGPTGSYFFNFTISYKKGGITVYSMNYVAPLIISDNSGDGKREIAAAEVDEDDYLEKRDDDDDVSVAPTSITIAGTEATWVPISVQNIGSRKVKDVTFTLNAHNSNVRVAYLQACTGANSLGVIAVGSSATSSYSISGAAGYYTLGATINYRIGQNYYSYPQSISLHITSGGSRAAELDYTVTETSSIRSEYVIGAGVGVGLFAGLAVIGAAIIVRKRTATTIA